MDIVLEWQPLPYLQLTTFNQLTVSANLNLWIDTETQEALPLCAVLEMSDNNSKVI